MKKDLHPTYQEKVTVKCSCGNSFETGSTEKALDIEVCSACHPFYTGKSKLVDAAGRVDKFRKKLKEVATSREKAPRQTKKTKGKDKVVKLG